MERLHDSLFRALFQSPAIGIAVIDVTSSTIIDANEAMLKILGRPREAVVDVPDVWREVTVEEYADATEEAFRRAIERGYSDPLVKQCVHPDGTRVPVRTRLGAVPDFPDRLVIFASDISDEWRQRAESESRERRLVAELNHQVKNALAIVQGFAHQSLRSERPVEEARRAFEGRLEALATAHDLLTEQRSQEIPMTELMRSSLAAHDNGGRRFAVDGPPLRLTPKSAVTLAMALHELATNATQYGALSTASGRVTVAWRHDGKEFTLRWQERGGPPRSAAATPGFGTRMIERALAAQFGGTSRFDYATHGLTFELVAAADEPL